MKRFPIQGGPSIPWEAVADHEQQAQNNHGQSLEELARRAGLGPGELYCVLESKGLRHNKRLGVSWAEVEAMGLARINEINEKYSAHAAEIAAHMDQIWELADGRLQQRAAG